ncbi:pentatricopeptide repeat-containing protein At5g39710-like [Aristolochia californica]|uniref:pentatricopeptide repeat-containing protein At5g39710-like n=1 Tax=Aristolochia californica TaxID=171875 RepID=UPI0035DD4C7B
MVEKGLGPTASTDTLPLTSLYEVGRLKEVCDCTLGNLNNAMRLLNFMQENGCPLDEWTFTELICGFFKMGTLHVALDMFNKMAACGLNPNKVSYTALIHGCCKREVIGLVLSLLDKIKEISCRPNVRTYNGIFNGFCTHNRLPEAEKLCTKIATQGLFPTVVTYTTLINGLCKSGATSLAFKVVDEMMKHNCLPNHHTYSTVIYGLCQEVNAMEVEFLFKEMQRKGLIPDQVTYTSVIDGPHGVFLNGLQKDQDVLEEDHIDGYLSRGKARGSTTVSSLLDRLLENGCRPYLYVTLLVGLWRKWSRHLSHSCALIKSLIAPSYSDGRTCWSDKVHCRTIGNWYYLATTAVASAALEYGQKHNIRRIVVVRDVAEALLLIYARSDTSRRSICGPHAIRTPDLVDKLPSMFHSIIILKILSRVTMIFV